MLLLSELKVLFFWITVTVGTGIFPPYVITLAKAIVEALS